MRSNLFAEQSRPVLRAVWTLVGVLSIAPIPLSQAVAQSAAARLKPFENVELRYAVSLPADCRHEEGPGTLEAICALDLDAHRSREVPAAGAILLEVDAEPILEDAKAYDVTTFKAELAEVVCGESGPERVVLRDVTERTEAGAVIHSAAVVCPEIKFLALPERSAEVRFMIFPRYRYRLIARWPSEATAVAGPVKDAFFASFRSSAGEPR